MSPVSRCWLQMGQALGKIWPRRLRFMMILISNMRYNSLSKWWLTIVLACAWSPLLANGGVIVERILEPTTLFDFLITNNGEDSVTIVFQIEGGDKQTLNLAPGASKLYTADKKFSHPPSFWFQ
jgi:hypothetical protein